MEIIKIERKLKTKLKAAFQRSIILLNIYRIKK